MIIMAVDPSTTVTGWAVIEAQDGSVVDYESGYVDAVRRTTKDGMGYRLDYIFRGLQGVAAKHDIHSVGMEAGFVGGNSSTSLVIGYSRAVVLMLAAGIDKPCSSYAPSMIKKHIAGSGRATKNDVNMAVRGLLGIDVPIQEDEADALAIGLTHLLALGAWDRMRKLIDNNQIKAPQGGQNAI